MTKWKTKENGGVQKQILAFKWRKIIDISMSILIAPNRYIYLINTLVIIKKGQIGWFCGTCTVFLCRL